jgi:type II secretion system protein G
MKTLKSKGFTLIELLVVVAIIGVLATIVLSSLSDARARSRDAKRLADIRTIQTALEVYHLDNGSYPLPSDVSYSSNSSWDELETLMNTTLPIDPINGEIEYEYRYYADISSAFCNGQAYWLGFYLESRNGDGVNDGVEICNGMTLKSTPSIFMVGVDRYGKFKTPDMSGTLKE